MRKGNLGKNSKWTSDYLLTAKKEKKKRKEERKPEGSGMFSTCWEKNNNQLRMETKKNKEFSESKNRELHSSNILKGILQAEGKWS